MVSITAAVTTFFRAWRARLFDRSWLAVRTELQMAKIHIEIEPISPPPNHLARADCSQKPCDSRYLSRTPKGCTRLGAIADRRERR
ncbi:MAG: hypothetical protein ACN4GW_14860 [Desulforhopalus sp.]